MTVSKDLEALMTAEEQFFMDLKGEKRHFCPDLGMQPIDETMLEYARCKCVAVSEKVLVPTTQIDIDTKAGADEWAKLQGICEPDDVLVIGEDHSRTVEKASKNDTLDNKPDYSLLPRAFLDQVAYVMMAGAQKYGRYNYTKGHNISQLTSAAIRHLKAIDSNEDIDQDTTDRINKEIHHAACVCANMLMLLHQKELGTLEDDRFKPEDHRPGYM